MRTLAKRLVVVAGLLGALIAAPVAQAHALGSGLLPTTWYCDGVGAVTFYLPPVTSPVAPYPGFLAPDGQTYVVDAAAPIGGDWVYVGQKTGLSAGKLTCTSFDFGVSVMVSPTGG